VKRFAWLVLSFGLSLSALAGSYQSTRIHVEMADDEKMVYWDGTRVLPTNEESADALQALKPYSGDYLCQVKGQKQTIWGQTWVRVAVIYAITDCHPLSVSR